MRMTWMMGWVVVMGGSVWGQTVSTQVRPGETPGAAAAAGGESRRSVVPGGRAKLSDVSYFAVAPAEPRTIKRHDLVTIVVREQSESTAEGKTDLKKNADFNAAITSYFQLRGLNLASSTPSSPLAMAMSGSRNMKGEATLENRDSFSTRVTAEVIDVKPNGNLVLQARSRTKVDEESREVILSGTCRAQDITADNTVLSTQLYDLDVQKTNTGSLRDTTERGWIPKILDRINPF